jgi:hypothetical protein
MSDFKGSNESKLEARVLNQTVSDRDLILASFNPLSEALCNTTVQMIFSKPFYHVVRGKDRKVDREKSEQVGDIFDNINFIEHAMVATGDAFDYGPGQFELSMSQNPETKWIEFDAASRRPADTFKRPKNTKIVSTSQRWKGIYEVDGVKYFDQTVDGSKIISLDPKRMFHMTPIGAKFPDGPGLVEMILPFLDGAQAAFSLSFVVMYEQLNPKELQVTDENLPGTGQIVSDILTSNNAIEKYPLPPNITMTYPQYKDREDVHKFFKFYEQIMYRIVYPVAALTSSDGGGGILDNSSNIVKQAIFYDHISSWRSKVARGANPLGNHLLDVNGWKKKGYKYELIPAPIAARDIEIESKIMSIAIKFGKVSTTEYRAWLNNTISGLRLEDFFEEDEQIQEGKKVQAPVSENIKNKMQKIEKGADPSSIVEEIVARRVA